MFALIDWFLFGEEYKIRRFAFGEEVIALSPKRLYKKELQSEKYEVMGGSV